MQRWAEGPLGSAVSRRHAGIWDAVAPWAVTAPHLLCASPHPPNSSVRQLVIPHFTDEEIEAELVQGMTRVEQGSAVVDLRAPLHPSVRARRLLAWPHPAPRSQGDTSLVGG